MTDQSAIDAATTEKVAEESASTTSHDSQRPMFTVDDHLTWLIGVFDAGEFNPAEVVERFDPVFLAEISVTDLNSPMSQIAPDGSAPWQILVEQRDGWRAKVTIESAIGTRLTLTLALASAEPHQIQGLLLQPAAYEAPDNYSAAQLDSDMTGLAQHAAVGIYNVTDGRCEAIHERNGDQPLAIGSIFKLWVLAELANQIHAGTAAWNEPLEVRAELRSNPDGRVYQLDDGDTFTLREYAEAMISISDNTATDHLIDRLGRSSIEAAMVRSGIAQPELNQPLPATRELFWLKFLADPPNPDDWYEADTAGRRAILEDLADKTVPWVLNPTLLAAPNAEGLRQDQPRNLDIEYLASPQDLCRTLLHLDQLASMAGLEPIADILSLNPGTDIDPQTWIDVRFKGGSEPGVIALSWWLRHADGRTFVVAGMLNDPHRAFDLFAAASVITNAISLI